MKIWYFLCWQWNQFETWQRCYMFAMFLIGCAFAAPAHMKSWFAIPGTVIILGFVLKWAVYDGVREAWNKYNKEQEEIVQIMRDSK